MLPDTRSDLELYFKDCERRGRKFRVGANLFLSLNVYSCSLFVWSFQNKGWVHIGRMQYKDIRFWDNCCCIGGNLFQDGFLAKL